MAQFTADVAAHERAPSGALCLQAEHLLQGVFAIKLYDSTCCFQHCHVPVAEHLRVLVHCFFGIWIDLLHLLMSCLVPL